MSKPLGQSLWNLIGLLPTHSSMCRKKMAMITHPEQVQRAINSKFAHAPPSRPPTTPHPLPPPSQCWMCFTGHQAPHPTLGGGLKGGGRGMATPAVDHRFILTSIWQKFMAMIVWVRRNPGLLALNSLYLLNGCRNQHQILLTQFGHIRAVAYAKCISSLNRIQCYGPLSSNFALIATLIVPDRGKSVFKNSHIS